MRCTWRLRFLSFQEPLVIIQFKFFDETFKTIIQLISVLDCPDIPYFVSNRQFLFSNVR